MDPAELWVYLCCSVGCIRILGDFCCVCDAYGLSLGGKSVEGYSFDLFRFVRNVLETPFIVEKERVGLVCSGCILLYPFILFVVKCYSLIKPLTICIIMDCSCD